MSISAKTVSLALLLTLPLAANPDRDKRHAHIREEMKKYANLEHPHFAPSVHIGYHEPDTGAVYLAYYNEIRIEESSLHTYFCTIGFQDGYLGIQDHGNGRLAIFSVWDKGGGQNDHSQVDHADRTEVLFTNEKAESSRFGGEGSGAKTMMPFAWETGKTYRFLVTLTPRETGTDYSAWIAPADGDWQKIASYRTVMSRKELRGFYSFIEDYARNGETGQHRRRALYPHPAMMTAAGSWQPVTHAHGTIADDVLQNGHSGVTANTFFSQSGADTPDYATVPKEYAIEQKDFSPELPADFPKVEKSK